MSPILVLMAGLPGNMAGVAANGILNNGSFSLLDIALSGEGHGGGWWEGGTKRIALVPPNLHKDVLKGLSRRYAIIVDFTVPASVNRNAELYIEYGIPFVMGTTGGDRQKLAEVVQNSDICAVIATNFSPSLTVFLAMLQWAAKEFPGALEGFLLEIIEAHQRTKKDDSGTAITWSEPFRGLGVQIPYGTTRIRDPKMQQALGIENFAGHAFHRYTLSDERISTTIEMITKVEGRQTYVPGVLAAISFLKNAIDLGSRGKVYSMIDVLRGQI